MLTVKLWECQRPEKAGRPSMLVGGDRIGRVAVSRWYRRTGVIEVSYLLFDQHVATQIVREGSNLISRNTSLQDAATAPLRNMSMHPVDLTSRSKVIFSVLKRGATTGTANYDRTILYQRYEYGALANGSKLVTAGGGSFGGPPDYQAANSDNNTGLQFTTAPPNLISVRGGMIYVTEVFTSHQMLTPVPNLGIAIPGTLYSIAYF